MNSTSCPTNSTPVVIIAGGQSRRLQLPGHNRKWQLPFGEKSLLEHMIDLASSISTVVAINGAEIDADHFSALPYPFIGDVKQQGPLSGILSALIWGKNNQFKSIITLPCDTPFIPSSWLVHLYQQFLDSNKPAMISRCRHQLHPLCGVWSTSLADNLTDYMQNDKKKAVQYWARQHATTVDYKESKSTIDIFMNINTPEDYKLALELYVSGAPF